MKTLIAAVSMIVGEMAVQGQVGVYWTVWTTSDFDTPEEKVQFFRDYEYLFGDIPEEKIFGESKSVFDNCDINSYNEMKNIVDSQTYLGETPSVKVLGIFIPSDARTSPIKFDGTVMEYQTEHDERKIARKKGLLYYDWDAAISDYKHSNPSSKNLSEDAVSELMKDAGYKLYISYLPPDPVIIEPKVVEEPKSIPYKDIFLWSSSIFVALLAAFMLFMPINTI